MKKSVWSSLLLLTFLVCQISLSQAQISTPQPSPGASVTQKIGLSDVSVAYSRPSVKGRKIFGELLPFGKLWRTGANAATKITFSDEITIEDKKIAAGEYSLFSIPGASEWTVILNKNPKVSSNEYKEAEDVARFTVKPEKTASPYETFTIDFSDVVNNGAFLNIKWENTRVKLKLVSDVDSKVMAQIQEKVANATDADANTYFQAAGYYFENGKDLKQALTWITKSVEKDPKFWTIHLKAKIQAKLKDYKGAVASAQKSIELAKTEKNDDYVRMNEKLIADVKNMK